MPNVVYESNTELTLDSSTLSILLGRYSRWFGIDGDSHVGDASSGIEGDDSGVV